MANDNKEKDEKNSGELKPITFNELDDPSETSVSSEIADPSLEPALRGGKLSNFWARALSFSWRATVDAKRMEIESVDELVRARTDLLKTVEKATKQDARYEQIENVVVAEQRIAVRDLDMEYREDMDDLEERESKLERRRQTREAVDADHKLKTSRRKKHAEIGLKRADGSFAKGEPADPVQQVNDAFYKRLNDIAAQAKKDIAKIQANDDMSAEEKKGLIDIVKEVKLQQGRQAKAELAKVLARIRKKF